MCKVYIDETSQSGVQPFVLGMLIIDNPLIEKSILTDLTEFKKKGLKFHCYKDLHSNNCEAKKLIGYIQKNIGEYVKTKKVRFEKFKGKNELESWRKLINHLKTLEKKEVFHLLHDSYNFSTKPDGAKKFLESIPADRFNRQSVPKWVKSESNTAIFIGIVDYILNQKIKIP